ncbi:hypothetical protein QTP70_019910, partial [Hemibagrus guttatus]
FWFAPTLAPPMFLWGASPHNVASVGGAAPPVISGGESGSTLLPPLGEFQSPARQTSSPRSRRSSVDIARCECLAVDVARSCCSAVVVTRLCCLAVDVVRRLRSAVDIASDPLALPSGPLLPPLVSLLLLTPPTCLALILVPPTCLALVLASPHSPCFCFSLPPKCLALLLAPPTGLSTFLALPQDPSLDRTFGGGLGFGSLGSREVTTYAGGGIKHQISEWSHDGRFSIHDNRRAGFFSVFIRELITEDTGSYGCGVVVSDELEIYTVVKLNVREDLSYEKSISETVHVGGDL